MDELDPRLKTTQGSVGRLLAKAGESWPWARDRREAVWQRLEASTGPKRTLPLPALAGAALLVGFIAAMTARALVAGGPQASTIDLQLEGIGTLSVTDEQGLKVPDRVAEDHEVFLTTGRMTAEIVPQRGRPFTVKTPHLRVTVVGTRFSVAVKPDLTEVEVSRGRVRVESPTGMLELGPGEQIRSDAPALSAAISVAPSAQLAQQPEERVAPTPNPTTAPADDREGGGRRSVPGVNDCPLLQTADSQRRCFLQFAADDKLAGQTALFSLGRLERQAGNLAEAASYGAMYERRFPEGVFGPEASAQLVADLDSLGKSHEGLEAAARFLARYPTNKSAGRVQLARARMLCRVGQEMEGFEELGRIQQGAMADSCELAFARGTCLAKLGHRAKAEAAFDEYLAQCPAGVRVTEIGRSRERR